MKDVETKVKAEVRKRIRDDAKGQSPGVTKIFDFIAKNMFNQNLDIAYMEREAGVRKTARNKFRKAMGIPVMKYVTRMKEHFATQMLTRSELDVCEVAYGLNYSQPNNFSRDYNKWTGRRPEDIIADARGGRKGRSFRSAAEAEKVREDFRNKFLNAAGSTPEKILEFKADELDDGESGQVVAQAVWNMLRLETLATQRLFLRNCVSFETPDLFELLSRKSRLAGRKNRQRGVEIAELALESVEGSAELLGERFRSLHILALARLGNARRLAGEFQAAEAAFVLAEEEAQNPTLQNSAVKGELLALKGALRFSQQRLGESRECLDEAMLISTRCQHVNLRIDTLFQRAAVSGLAGLLEDMIRDLGEVEELLETQGSQARARLLGVYQELALAHIELGEVDLAEEPLYKAKALCEEFDHSLSRLQLLWIEGMVTHYRGAADSAEILYREARSGFVEMGDKEAAAQVTMNLVILCHEQARHEEVMSLLATEVLPIFEALHLDRDALAALEILREAIDAHAISRGALDRLRKALKEILLNKNRPGMRLAR